MKKLFLGPVVLALLITQIAVGPVVSAQRTARPTDLVPQPIPFFQNWSNASLITTTDNWTGVPGFIGYRGDDLNTTIGADPQTVLLDGSATPVDVNANSTDAAGGPTTPTNALSGGIFEFDNLPDPVVAMQGSNTADVPQIVMSMNATGITGLNISYNLRDLDADDTGITQPFALQYRIGNTGNYTNIPAGFVADASNDDATLVTPVSAALPAACNNQPIVNLRILTVNAVGNDAMIGIDDISVTHAPIDPAQHLLLGNPSNATVDVNNFSNYLLTKTQYAMSYHRDRGIPNWVAWHLDASWLGSVSTQNDYRPDVTLPAGWYEAQNTDYTGSGFDRGQLCPAGDRSDSAADNSATFVMTNMMPLAPDNAEGPWATLETYSRNLAAAGNELYVYAGSAGQGGTGANGAANTVAAGHVVVPKWTWKVIMVLPGGSNDLDRITKSTRTIAVIIPNNQGIRLSTWQTFRTNIMEVEALTGLNFLTTVRPQLRRFLKHRVDLTVG